MNSSEGVRAKNIASGKNTKSRRDNSVTTWSTSTKIGCS